ncbi:MAG: hypothetical protein LCH99_30560 [Proteobacteria bacterium]|nr:hypothetical protein [Pseudomonadota bacterium]
MQDHIDNLSGGVLNVAEFWRKQNLLCRGNQRFRGKNAEGLLGLPRFSLFAAALSQPYEGRSVYNVARWQHFRQISINIAE